MPRLRAPERRRQILEVAAVVFAERGYRGATTKHLADAAGITEPILYRHFGNKLDLFVTLIEEVSHEVVDSWRSLLNRIDDPRKRLRLLLEGNPATHSRGRGIYRVIFQAMTEFEDDRESEKKIGPAIRAHITELHEFLRDELAVLQRAGVVRRDEPAAALASLLVNVAVGYGITAPLVGGRSPTITGRKSIQRLIEELITSED